MYVPIICLLYASTKAYQQTGDTDEDIVYCDGFGLGDHGRGSQRRHDQGGMESTAQQPRRLLRDGLTPYADLVFFDHEALDPAFDNDGSVFLVGMTASF